jgi:ring-1,2-phenylacetyl-CoA epoxidase subunit PaaC
VTPKYATADDIAGDERLALIDLLYRLADDDLILGHRNSEWTGLGPILEADIAFSSMAQDEIGQARAYYTLLHELGEPDPDAMVFERDAGSFRCCSLASLERGDWAFSTARQYLYDVAKSKRLTNLSQSAYLPLAQLARKLGGEQKYHMMHSRMWIARLGRGTEESSKRMREAVEKAYPHALGMFEPTTWDKLIAGSGIGPLEFEVQTAWAEEVADHLRESGLETPTNAKPVHGGRSGSHPDDLQRLLTEMQKVHRLDPQVAW